MNHAARGLSRVLAAWVIACAPVMLHAAEAAIGAPAPNLVLRYAGGGSAELAEWLGKRPVYLKMWATWCSTCRAEMPHFKALYEQYGQEIAFLAVNAGINDTAADVVAFNTRYGLEMPSVIDTNGQIGRAFGFVATPYNILIDRDGAVVFLGRAPEERLDALLAGLAQAGNSDAGIEGSNAVRPLAEPGVPQEGEPAPGFTIGTLSGETFTLDGTAADGPTYLLFFATWCESYMAGEGEDPDAAAKCTATRRAVEEAFAGTGDPPRLIGIATRMWTGPKDLEQYRDEYDPPYPLALDVTNEVFRLYGVREFPTLIAVADGRILRRLAGAIEAFPKP